VDESARSDARETQSNVKLPGFRSCISTKPVRNIRAACSAQDGRGQGGCLWSREDELVHNGCSAICSERAVLQRAIVDVSVANELKSIIIGADQMMSKLTYTFSSKRSNRSKEFPLSFSSN
jgi:hypothetical protein